MSGLEVSSLLKTAGSAVTSSSPLVVKALQLSALPVALSLTVASQALASSLTTPAWRGYTTGTLAPSVVYVTPDSAKPSFLSISLPALMLRYA